MVGYTIVTRESEWDDDTRDRALGLAEYQNSLCGCGCGRPAAETIDGKTLYRVHNVVCEAGRAMERVRRDERKKHEKDPSWDDGRHFFVVPADPNDPEVKAAANRPKRGRRRPTTEPG